MSFILKWLISWQSIIKGTELKVYLKEFNFKHIWTCCTSTNFHYDIQMFKPYKTYKVFTKLLTVDKRQVNNNWYESPHARVKTNDTPLLWLYLNITTTCCHSCTEMQIITTNSLSSLTVSCDRCPLIPSKNMHEIELDTYILNLLQCIQ